MIFEFEGFRFDAATRSLSRDGRAVPLRSQGVALLGDLIARRARWVTRAEIAARVWRGMRVSASSHSTLLAEVRRAVGDDGRSQHVIRTCRRRGHRFVAPVALCDGARTHASLEWPGDVRTTEHPLGVCDASLDGERSWDDAAMHRAESSLEIAALDGPRHLAVSGPGAIDFAREWSGVAADRGWQLYRGWRTDPACPALWPWWQVAVSLRDATRRPGESRADAERADWARLVREIEWVARHPGPGPPERQRRYALLDGLTRALLRRAAARPHVLLLEGRDARDPWTDRVLAFLLATHAATPLWIVTWSPTAAAPPPPIHPTRTDFVALAPDERPARLCPRQS